MANLEKSNMATRLGKKWTTHMPMLIKYAELSDGPILEIGAGLFSTPLLHWICYSRGIKLVTYENDPEFYKFAKGFQSGGHSVRFVKDWNEIDTKTHWGLVFIDHHPAGQRGIDAIKFKDRADYIILHDSDDERKENIHNYDQAYPHFKYRYDWKDCKPWTTVLSNFKVLPTNQPEPNELIISEGEKKEGSKKSPLDYILEKYRIDKRAKLPIEIPNTGRDDLAELLKELDFKVGVEVGVAGGDYSKKLCEKNHQMFFYGIDPWQAYSSYSDYPQQIVLDQLYEKTKVLMTPFSNYGIIREFSMEAVKKFEDNSLDFVYLDGNHEKPYIEEDIAAWSKKLRSGGIMSGHDYVHFNIDKATGRKFGVIEATNKYAEENKITTWFVLGRKEKKDGEIRDRHRSWFWVKP